MDTEILFKFIKPELLVLVPVLYAIGVGLKKSKSFDDEKIPLIIGLFGVVIASLYIVATATVITTQSIIMMIFVALTQGILCAAVSVYADQLIKQHIKTQLKEVVMPDVSSVENADADKDVYNQEE